MFGYKLQESIIPIVKKEEFELYIPYNENKRSSIILSFLSAEPDEDYFSYLDTKSYISILNQRHNANDADLAPYHFFVAEEKDGVKIFQNKNPGFSLRFPEEFSPYDDDISIMVCARSFATVSKNLFYSLCNLISMVSYHYCIMIDSIVLRADELDKYEDFLEEVKRVSVFLRNSAAPVFSVKEAVEYEEKETLTLTNLSEFDSERYQSAAFISGYNLNDRELFLFEGNTLLFSGCDYVLSYNDYLNRTEIYFPENKTITNLSAFALNSETMYLIENKDVMLFHSAQSDAGYQEFLDRLPIKPEDFYELNLHIFVKIGKEYSVRSYEDTVVVPADIEPKSDYDLLNTIKHAERNYFILEKLI